jgi:CelD/BcsL family acetyltransferase involved in cellulose biosynthesis
MDLSIINPLTVPDWDESLLKSGDQSFFHTSAWARVLAESYGHEPMYLAGYDHGRLALLMPFMEISSIFTGKRGVSLPFADYCDPFASDKSMLPSAVQCLIDFGKQRKWDYAEWRSVKEEIGATRSPESFVAHELVLGRTESELFLGLRGNGRRNIKKAKRTGVTVQIDDSAKALRAFYQLHCMTRKRQGLPPQPYSFFRHIQKYVLSAGRGIVVSGLVSGKVIAGAVFFHFDQAAIFKYGASDARFLSHRPNNLVLWEAIRWYNARGIKMLSLGRTECENAGLLRYKRSWGATENELRYYRHDYQAHSKTPMPLPSRHIRRALSRSPMGFLRLLGRLLYKHIG